MSVISEKFNLLSFDNSHKVISEQSKVDEFINSCNGIYDIFLGESEKIHSYPYMGVVYFQNIYNPISKLLEYRYCGVSSSTDEKKLLKRPNEDWYNFKLKYAGKKVEEIREKISIGNYNCKTRIAHRIFGKNHDEVQRALNILEVYNISQIPEDQKLNTAKGGGNYTKGRRIATLVFENENYISDEEDERNETSYWLVSKSDLIEFKNNDTGYYFAGGQYDTILQNCRKDKIRMKEIKYKDLSDHGKKMVEDKYLIGSTLFEGDDKKHDCFIIDSKKKEELEGLVSIDMRCWYDLRNVACIRVEYKENYIDFSKTEGYATIKDCFEDSPETCYGTVRNYVNEGCYGYYKFSNFLRKYLGMNFDI